MAENKVILEAEPEPLEIDLRRTGIIIIDMQNCFLTKGAYFDLMGYDISPGVACIEPIKKLSNAARAKGLKVVNIYATNEPGDGGPGPESVYWHKEATLKLYRQKPELKDKLRFVGTWGAQIVKDLQPQVGDAIVEKPRYSAFYDTNLDTVLKRYNLKYLITTGIATNMCVEATIRDAYYHGYFPIMVFDATAAAGPAFMQEATAFNVKTAYGWVTKTANVLKILQ